MAGRRTISAQALSAYQKLAKQLAGVGREMRNRGWALGTSGNFSAVITGQPLSLAITATGVDKATLAPQHVILVDDRGERLAGSGAPSAETALHLAVVRARNAGAVLHTHSVWATLLSERFAAAGGLSLEGYEMLKGLDGVATHEHAEWLPIIENRQDTVALARDVERSLQQHPLCHGFLIRRHGLYTWGKHLAEARRHVEVLEFLLEVVGRSQEQGSSLPMAPEGDARSGDDT